jgi:hypothetical protein
MARLTFTARLMKPESTISPARKMVLKIQFGRKNNLRG